MTPLIVELHRWMGLPHIWGETDCMMVLGDWVEKVTGIDPAADLRFTYDSRGSCQKETGFYRDPVGVAAKYFEGVANLKRGNDLRAGDVAIIIRLDGVRPEPSGAVWLGTAWGCKGPNGTTTLSPKLVQVQAFWSVGYEN